MLRAFLFDFDGTIADTEPLHHAALAEVLGRYGMVLPRAVYDEHYLSRTDRDCLVRATEEYRRPDLRPRLDELFREKIEAMDRLLREPVSLCPGVRAFLDRAASVGPLAVVTGAVRHEVEGVLEREGLRRFFLAVVAAEDIAHGKPDPEGYRTGLRRLRRMLPDLDPGECLAIEDAPSGVLSAQRAGMRALGLTHSLPAERLAGADLVAACYAEVEWGRLWRLFE